MRAVLMSGGLGTRLRPLTLTTNKHLLTVYDRPMIQRNVELLVASGIKEILVLLNHAFAQSVMEVLEDGAQFGASILYGYQRDVVSIGRHLAVAETFAQSQPFLLLLGDSFYTQTLTLPDPEQCPHMWVMPLGDEDDFHKYAEVTLSADGRHVTSITPNPDRQTSGIIQTGAWILPPDVFDRARRLIQTSAGEVRVRTIVTEYVDDGHMSATLIPRDSFLDLGTHEALLRANRIARISSSK